MLKNIIRRSAQHIFGFNRYLFLFSLFNIYRIRIFKGEEAFRFFMEMISRKGEILDIGANIGVNTTILATKFPGRTIHAFEPIPENYEALEKAIRFHSIKNVQLYKTALGNKTGTAEMVMPDYKGSRMQGWSRMATGDIKGEKYAVPVQQLDHIGFLQILPVCAIKIDVENFEYCVLQGAETLIRKNKPLIFCELWNDEHRQLCFDFLLGMGYEVMIYQNKKLVSFNGEDALNYFFIHPTPQCPEAG